MLSGFTRESEMIYIEFFNQAGGRFGAARVSTITTRSMMSNLYIRKVGHFLDACCPLRSIVASLEILRVHTTRLR